MKINKMHLLHLIGGMLVGGLLYLIGFHEEKECRINFLSDADVPQLKEAFVPIKESVFKELIINRVADMGQTEWVTIKEEDRQIIITGKDYALFKIAFLGDLGLQNKETWDTCLSKIDSLCSYDGKMTLTLALFKHEKEEYVQVPAGMLRELLKEKTIK